MKPQRRGPSESTRRRNYSIVSRRFAFAFFTGRQICISLFDLTDNEMAHRGQHIFERRAVDFPDGQEEPADERSDDETDRAKEKETSERADEDEKIGHFCILPDELWTQHVVDRPD